ncbi:MAG: DnaA regulatory inactivator Hda [Gammaproteobacteria bacterium]|nr:MAG: DnaA regulatory inactivator Hda [Gammaproteobacteria bacterium]
MNSPKTEKTEIKQQIPLGLGHTDNSSFENFYPSGNEQILADIDNFLADEHIKILYLWGGAGSGKTHLLHAIQNIKLETGDTVYYLPFSNVKHYPVEALEGLENARLICLDELEHIAGVKQWEEAVFHLLNRTWNSGNRIVVAATDNVHEVGFALADLSSRLQWGFNCKVKLLNDAEKQECLKYRAELRGFEITDEVCSFLIKRLPRDMQQLFDFLDLIDNQSLVEKRKVTVPFVKSLLENKSLENKTEYLGK